MLERRAFTVPDAPPRVDPLERRASTRDEMADRWVGFERTAFRIG